MGVRDQTRIEREALWVSREELSASFWTTEGWSHTLSWSKPVGGRCSGEAHPGATLGWRMKERGLWGGLCILGWIVPPFTKRGSPGWVCGETMGLVLDVASWRCLKGK